MKLTCITSLIVTALLTTVSVVSAVTITPKEEFWALDGGSMGTRGLRYPALLDANQQPIHKLVEKQIQGQKATFIFAGGAKIETVVGDDGTITFEFSGVPEDVGFFRLNMFIPQSFVEGGGWKFDNDEEKPFPREKPEGSPHLHQGNAGQFTLKHREGRSLVFTLPSEHTFNQLQDNREWGEKIFQWIVIAPFHREVTAYKIQITEQAAAPGAVTQPKAMIDPFGQNALAEFPEKVKSLEELKADVEAERAYYASLTPPERDAYGGLPGSGQALGLNKTGFFHVEKHGERWYLVNPDGNAFFHLGVSSFAPMQEYTYVEGRKNMFAWLPPASGEFADAYMPGSNNTNFSFHLANLIRKYGHSFSLGDYQTLMIDRVRKWGFNAIGAFSPMDYSAVTAARMPYMRELPLNAYSGMPIIPGVRETFDPFDERSRERAIKGLAKLVPYVNDPLLIGFYVSNEPGLEDLPRVIPTLGAKYACKRKLVETLQQKYGTIEAFNQAWGMSATSFDELNGKGLPVTTKAASEDMQQFVGLFLDEYYRFIRDEFKKVDPNHILIGNRLQSGTINNEQLCRISAKYLDAISFNYYTYSLDKAFLNRIYGWTGKPMFLSEFYWGAPAESGLPGGVKDASSQDERGLAYRNYVEQAAATDYIIGVEWYTLMDMCYAGVYYMKASGDNANCGLISITDRPWKTMLAHMSVTNYDIYKIHSGEKAPFVYDNPRYNSAGAGERTVKIYRTTGDMKIDGVGDGWPNIPSEVIPTDRVVEGADGGKSQADFKLAWDDQNLYLLMNVTDPTPMLNEHKGDTLWMADGIELFIGGEKVDQAGPLLFTDRQVLLGAGSKPLWYFVNQPKQPEIQLAVTAAVDGKGYTLEAAIPLSAIELKPKAGQQIRFDLGVDDSSTGRGRSRQLMWNGTARNAGDRTHWGHATFIR